MIPSLDLLLSDRSGIGGETGLFGGLVPARFGEFRSSDLGGMGRPPDVEFVLGIVAGSSMDVRCSGISLFNAGAAGGAYNCWVC